MIHNYYAIKAQAEAMADRLGLCVQYKDDIPTAATDGNIIYVPTPSPQWSEDRMLIWQMYFYHEIGHNVPEMRDTFNLIKEKEINMQSFFGSCLNLLDDNRQEHFNYDIYTNQTRVLSQGRKLFTQQQIEELEVSEDPKMTAIRALAVWDIWHRSDWMPDLINLDQKLLDKLPEKSHEYVQKLKEGDYKSEMYNCRTAYDVYDLNKRIINEVFELDADEEEKDAQEQYVESREGEQKAGEGEEGKSNQDSEVDYSELLMHKHDEHSGNYGSLNSLHINYDTEDSGYLPANNVVLLDFPKDNIQANNRHSWEGEDYYHDKITGMQAGNGFSRKIRKILQVLSQSHYEYGKKAGKLNQKAAYKVCTGVSDKVFKKKYQTHTLDTAVSILVDMSGSMGGDKYVHASHSAVLLNQAIAKLQVPVEILGFTEHNGDDVVHAIFKTFNQTITDEKLVQYFVKGSQYMGNNADGESIQWAYERLAVQPNKRKVLIVLSDGSPASSRSGIYSYTKEVIQSIEKSPVEVYGIGIQDRNVENLYKQCTVIHHAEELEHKLLEVVKERVL